MKAFGYLLEEGAEYFPHLKWPVYASKIVTVRNELPGSFEGGVIMLPNPSRERHVIYSSYNFPTQDNLSLSKFGRVYPYGQDGIVMLGTQLAFYDCTSRKWSMAKRVFKAMG